LPTPTSMAFNHCQSYQQIARPYLRTDGHRGHGVCDQRWGCDLYTCVLGTRPFGGAEVHRPQPRGTLDGGAGGGGDDGDAIELKGQTVKPRMPQILIVKSFSLLHFSYENKMIFYVIPTKMGGTIIVQLG